MMEHHGNHGTRTHFNMAFIAAIEMAVMIGGRKHVKRFLLLKERTSGAARRCKDAHAAGFVTSAMRTVMPESCV